jgi:endonuclease YncB( thermonuclease family)
VLGTVEKVISGRVIFLRVNGTGRSHLVELAAVKTPFRLSNAWNIAKLELEKRVLGKEVSVWVSSSIVLDSNADLIGVLFLGPTDINFDLINLGFCKYRRAPAYSMSNYTECTYRQAEKAAIQAKRGVWHD